MDLTQLAADAGQFINRAVQYTEESLGQADKTGLDPGLEELLARVDATKTWTDQIISQTEVLLQPNSGARLEDRLYEHLDWNAPPRPRAHEVLGDQMTQAGLEMGANTPYGTALLRCGEAQKQLGEAERKFVQSTNIHFLSPLRSFTEGDYRSMQAERKMLVNKRLDLDIAKTRLRKAYEADREGRNLNANPLEDDYLSHVSYMFSFLRVKWLKMWAQEISQAEMEQRVYQSLFDRQSQITRQVVEGIHHTHTNHMRSLTDFVEAQASYFDQCNQHAQELQRQLASIPALLCSNNWQSAISDEVNQPSTSNHVVNEPVALNQLTPIPVVVHQIPDFDQDSWTATPTATEKTGSSVTTQPNNNNNNNNAEATGRRSAVSDHVCTSALDQVSELGRTSSTQTNGATSLTTAAAAPRELSGTSASDAITNEDVVIETLTTRAEPQATNETTSEPSAVNGEDVQESPASQDVVQ